MCLFLLLYSILFSPCSSCCYILSYSLYIYFLLFPSFLSLAYNFGRYLHLYYGTSIVLYWTTVPYQKPSRKNHVCKIYVYGDPSKICRKKVIVIKLPLLMGTCSIPILSLVTLFPLPCHVLITGSLMVLWG